MLFQLIILHGSLTFFFIFYLFVLYIFREKVTVSSPIYNSFYNLLKYHLGTVAFGSLIITIITVIKALIRGLVNSKFAKLLIDCCLGALEDFLKYLSKNAYIQTGINLRVYLGKFNKLLIF